MKKSRISTDAGNPDCCPSSCRKSSRLASIVLFATAALVVAGAIIMTPMVMTGADKDALIKIPKSATSQMVADTLTKYLGESYSKKVMRLARIRGVDYSKRHGAYLIPKEMSPLRAQHLLHRGAQHPLTLTFNGFRSKELLANRISAKLDFPPDSIMQLLNDSSLMASYGLTTDQALALFLEDSYEVYWSASPLDVINKIGKNYRQFWNAERRDKAQELRLTPAEVSIVASIADQETNQEQEKGAIGRLYVNRLWTNMKLQADPTVRFALSDYTIKRVTSKHLQVESPYNTYKHHGLPPGLISTTSARTIDAILNSEPSTYLYMCAREDFSGYHNFANTYREHVANALRYQHALDRRGIK